VEKPTFASVTVDRCSCGFLEQAADDPKLPIRFDQSVGEYNFEFPSPCVGETCPEAKAQLRIYHCPFCGGAAPPSKRETLFAHISDEEAARIYRMFHGMRTLEVAPGTASLVNACPRILESANHNPSLLPLEGLMIRYD
jgi:hypothetical protein